MPAAEPKAVQVTVPALLSRIAEIAPTLEEGARQSEVACHLVDASVQALEAGGFFRLWWPQELGGPGAGLVDGIAVIEALAQVDTASAWNVAVGTTSGGAAGAYLPDQAVEAIFAGGPVIVAGQMAPIGQATPVDGGLRVTGRWSFGSGIHQATWVLGGVKIGEADGTPEAALVFVPRDQVQVDEESWQVMGLSGTGSCDYSMTDVFVPEGFWCSFPAPRRIRGGPAFDLHIPAQVIILHAGFAMGAARRSLREITQLARTKMRAFAPGSVGSRMTFQRDLAEAEARLTSACLYIYDVARRTEQAAPGDLPRLFLEGRAASRYVTDVALDIATWAYRNGGGTSLRLNSPLQRVVRDLMAASQHVFVDEIAYTAFGAQLLEVQS
jgi:alkylation response protein AidB-like acyl-CoA dehydrogenase